QLHKIGVSVALIERAKRYPDVLRAEKIEPDQAERLRRLGAMDYRIPDAPPLGNTINYRSGGRSSFDTVEQYGISYHETVNSMRDGLLGGIPVVFDEIARIETSEQTQLAHTRSGQSIECRLIVMATGGSEKILQQAGVVRRSVPSLKSLTVGFDIKSTARVPPAFSGFNYFLDKRSEGVDYVTFFRVGERMRTNVFTQWEPRTPALKHMSANPRESLLVHFPDLEAQIGSFEVTGKVQFFKTAFYRLGNVKVPGVVAIGDEYQSVCPATGTGLSKLSTDVEVLATECIPRWLSTQGMGKNKIAEYYDAPAKIAVDNDSLDRWRYYRDRLSPTWKVQLYRLEHLAWRMRS
ncbi:MAG: FAD-dependent oxidoreductase, partial [Gammaproteobacteria bacterium]